MDRRQFIKSLGILVVVACVPVSLLPVASKKVADVYPAIVMSQDSYGYVSWKTWNASVILNKDCR